MEMSLRKDPSVSSAGSTTAALSRLCAEASLEVGVHDAHLLASSRHQVPDDARLYVSHLPKQAWSETAATCRTIRSLGLTPIPHLPVRLMPDANVLDDVLRDLVTQAGVSELLLIAGDYASPVGSFASVSDVLRTGSLARHGIRKVSMAGHPEGHPKVPLAEIRRAERDKCTLAAQQGLEVCLVTQFFFAAQPFLQWAGDLRRDGVTARLVAGVAGPTRLSTLLKFAARCGVGPSLKALTNRPSSLLNLVGEHGPEEVLSDLAQAELESPSLFDGIHLFSFGGFARTCEWLHGLTRS